MFSIVSALLFSMVVPENACGASMDKLLFYGYIDLEYKQTTGNKYDGSGEDDANMKNGAFDQHHFNILMEATVTSEIAAKAHLEFEHGIYPGAGDAAMVLEYAFVEYVKRNGLKFRWGKMLSPWGIYNEIHDSTPAYLSVYPPELFYRSGTKGGFALIPKWITGMTALGGVPTGISHTDIDYIVYIGNGESRVTINENEHDDNQNKAVGCRLQLTDHDEAYQVGISAYYGDKATSRDKLSETHWTTVFHADFNWREGNLRGEYGRSVLGTQTETSWYVQTSWRFGRYTPYLRYQTLNPHEEGNDEDWTIYLAGVNVKVTDYLFYKIEWNEHKRGSNNRDIVTGEPLEYGEFRSALTLLF